MEHSADNGIGLIYKVHIHTPKYLKGKHVYQDQSIAIGQSAECCAFLRPGFLHPFCSEARARRHQTRLGHADSERERNHADGEQAAVSGLAATSPARRSGTRHGGQRLPGHEERVGAASKGP